MSRTHVRRRVAVVAAGLAVAAGLSACGGTLEPGSAAVVNGRRITVSDVQQATKDVQAAVGPDQAVQQRLMLYYLVVSPYLQRLASSKGQGVSEDDARQQLLQRSVAHPSPAGVEVVRALVAQSLLAAPDGQPDPQVVQQMRDLLASSHISVNPRYGTLDEQTLTITAPQLNWLVAAPAEPGAAQAP